MAVTKLSVSMDDEIAETVKQAAHDEGVTVSAWLSAAATARIRNRLLGEAIAEAASGIWRHRPGVARSLDSASTGATPARR